MANKIFSLPSARLKWNAVINRTRSVGKTLFSKYLLITNVTISTTLSGVGDALQQKYEIWTGDDPNKLWNQKRSSDMAVTGAVVGVICHYWYFNLKMLLVLLLFFKWLASFISLCQVHFPGSAPTRPGI